MKGKETIHNFIIYLFVLISLIAAAGYGYDEEFQFFSSAHNNTNDCLNAPAFLVNNDLHTFQVRKSNTTVLRFRMINDKHNEAVLKNGFLFLSILTVLSVFFHLIQRIIVFYCHLYVRDRVVVIRFIHNKDGRKRLA